MRQRSHHRGRLVLLLVALCLPAATLSAAESTPALVRTAVKPEGEIWVGQRVVYQLDVLAKDGWAQIQRLPDLQASGAIVVRMETQGVRLNDTIDGIAHAGQRYELLLFPQRGGEIAVPAAPVEIEISQWGRQAEKKTVQASTPSLRFSARMPPGAEMLHGLISTDRLTADQKWEPDAETLPVGGAVERRITVHADNVSAMAFPPLAFAGNDAVDVYPDSPVVEDRYQRGDLTAHRTDAVTYLFKRPGSIELPAVTITWWDLGRNTLQETVLPARTFSVAPAPSAAASGTASASTAEDATVSLRWPLAVSTVLLLLTAPLLVYRTALHRRWQAWRKVRQYSEKAFYRQFTNAARSGKPSATLNALMHWLDRIREEGPAARLDLFLEAFSDDAGRQAAEALIQATVADKSTAWEARHLLDAIAKARRRWKARRPLTSEVHRLPRLNP